MTDPAAEAARSAAAILATDLGPGLPAEVEAALAVRSTPSSAASPVVSKTAAHTQRLCAPYLRQALAIYLSVIGTPDTQRVQDILRDRRCTRP